VLWIVLTWLPDIIVPEKDILFVLMDSDIFSIVLLEPLVVAEKEFNVVNHALMTVNLVDPPMLKTIVKREFMNSPLNKDISVMLMLQDFINVYEMLSAHLKLLLDLLSFLAP